MLGEESFPVFVSEGDYRRKLDRIQHNTYLNFAHDVLLGSKKDIVIFGFALGTMDQHIVNAVNKWKDRRVAVSLFPSPGLDIRQEKLRLASKLAHDRVLFFNSRSHPLGAPSMCVDEDLEENDSHRSEL